MYVRFLLGGYCVTLRSFLVNLDHLLRIIEYERESNETVRLVINDPAEKSLQESFLIALFHSKEREQSALELNSIYFPDLCLTLRYLPVLENIIPIKFRLEYFVQR
jgi:hypothetical protein